MLLALNVGRGRRQGKELTNAGNNSTLHDILSIVMPEIEHDDDEELQRVHHCALDDNARHTDETDAPALVQCASGLGLPMLSPDFESKQGSCQEVLDECDDVYRVKCREA